MRRFLRLVCLDFVSREPVAWRLGLLGHGRISRNGDLARLPGVWCHSVGLEKSRSLPQWSLQKRDRRAEPWVRVTSGSDWLPRGMGSPICGLMVQPLKSLTGAQVSL